MTGRHKSTPRRSGKRKSLERASAIDEEDKRAVVEVDSGVFSIESLPDSVLLLILEKTKDAVGKAYWCSVSALNKRFIKSVASVNKRFHRLSRSAFLWKPSDVSSKGCLVWLIKHVDLSSICSKDRVIYVPPAVSMEYPVPVRSSEYSTISIKELCSPQPEKDASQFAFIHRSDTKYEQGIPLPYAQLVSPGMNASKLMDVEEWGPALALHKMHTDKSAAPMAMYMSSREAEDDVEQELQREEERVRKRRPTSSHFKRADEVNSPLTLRPILPRIGTTPLSHSLALYPSTPTCLMPRAQSPTLRKLPRRATGGQVRAYSDEENGRLFRYIDENPGANPRALSFWKGAYEKDILPGRTAGGMCEHYRKLMIKLSNNEAEEAGTMMAVASMSESEQMENVVEAILSNNGNNKNNHSYNNYNNNNYDYNNYNNDNGNFMFGMENEQEEIDDIEVAEAQEPTSRGGKGRYTDDEDRKLLEFARSHPEENPRTMPCWRLAETKKVVPGKSARSMCSRYLHLYATDRTTTPTYEQQPLKSFIEQQHPVKRSRSYLTADESPVKRRTPATIDDLPYKRLYGSDDTEVKSLVTTRKDEGEGPYRLRRMSSDDATNDESAPALRSSSRRTYTAEQNEHLLNFVKDRPNSDTEDLSFWQRAEEVFPGRTACGLRSQYRIIREREDEEEEEEQEHADGEEEEEEEKEDAFDQLPVEIKHETDCEKTTTTSTAGHETVKSTTTAASSELHVKKSSSHEDPPPPPPPPPPTTNKTAPTTHPEKLLTSGSTTSSSSSSSSSGNELRQLNVTGHDDTPSSTAALATGSLTGHEGNIHMRFISGQARFTEEDDERIMSFVHQHVTKDPETIDFWESPEAKKMFPGRSGHGLRFRYLSMLIPDAQDTSLRPFTEDECECMKRYVREKGAEETVTLGYWEEAVAHGVFPGRSADALRATYLSVMKTAMSGSHVNTDPSHPTRTPPTNRKRSRDLTISSSTGGGGGAGGGGGVGGAPTNAPLPQQHHHQMHSGAREGFLLKHTGVPLRRVWSDSPSLLTPSSAAARHMAPPLRKKDFSLRRVGASRGVFMVCPGTMEELLKDASTELNAPILEIWSKTGDRITNIRTIAEGACEVYYGATQQDIDQASAGHSAS